MSLQHVGHKEIAQFAEDKVNLPKEKASEYRAQARNLREKLEGYLSEHPDFTLKKMMLATTNTVAPLPMPNQMIASGIQAMPAIDCRKASSGSSRSEVLRFSAMAMPSGSAMALPIRKPAASRSRL